VNLFLFHVEIFNLACNDGALLKMNGIECGFLIDEGLVTLPTAFAWKLLLQRVSFSEFLALGLGWPLGAGM